MADRSALQFRGMSKSLPLKLETCLRESALISHVLENWEQCGVPDCWLAAGAVVQSYWNYAHGFPSAHGIKDVDIVYFDGDDLSDEAERRNSIRINRVFGDLGIDIDVKNEARVHLWYEHRFGYPIQTYSSVEEAISTFPTIAGAIRIRPGGGRLTAIAPFGFDDLMNLLVKPNKKQITPAIYEEKVGRWKAHWPGLKILGWEES